MKKCVQVDLTDLERDSKIFGKDAGGTKLTEYQKAINKASRELVQENYALVKNRGELFTLARKKVNDEGYPYSKKIYSSTAFGVGATPPKPKRRYMQSSLREEHIKSVSSAIQSHDETIALLQKQKQKYSSAEKYLEAAEINKSILEMMEQKQLKVKELEKLNKAQTRSKKTKKKKARKETSSDMPSSLESWLTKESSSKSGDDTEILETDKSGNGVQVLSQAERQARKENFYNCHPSDSESEQSEPTSTQVQPPAEKVGEESPEINFF